MPNFDQIISLIKKTGDKLIVLDHNGEPNYVLMSLNDYENLLTKRAEVGGLTEDEFLDKINRDIAIWKDNQEASRLPIDQYDFSKELGEFSSFGEKFYSPNQEDNTGDNDEDRYYFEPVE